MSRLWMSGGEANDATIDGAVSVNTVANGGGRSFATGATVTYYGTLGRSYYLRAYVYATDATPTADTDILILNYPNNTVNARLKTDGTLQLYQQQVGAIGSPSAAINTGQWYRVEIRGKIASGVGDEAEFLLNGTQVAVITGQSWTDVTLSNFSWAVPAGTTLYFDDIAFNDDQGESQNSWPGEGKIVLLLPTSNNNIGNWLSGSGANGTNDGNQWDAINNCPPVGTATPNATTACISNKVSGADATYGIGDFNVTSWANAGLSTGDTISTMQLVAVHGEDVNTGTKTGSFRLLINGVETGWAYCIGAVTQQFGPDGGGPVGTYPSNWVVQRAPATGATTTSSTVLIRAIKSDTNTRSADFCFMGVYVDYIPAAPTYLPISRIPIYGPLLAQ